MSNPGYDYEKHIGETIGYLTVLGIAPRERNAKGQLKPVKYICKCFCGSISYPMAYNVINGRISSCGCRQGEPTAEKLKRRAAFLQASRKELGVETDDDCGDSIIAARLKAKFLCPYPTGACVRSEAIKLCCRECDKFNDCGHACRNTPQNCGAKQKPRRRGRPLRETPPPDAQKCPRNDSPSWREEFIPRWGKD